MDLQFLSSRRTDILIIFLAGIIWFSLLGYRDLIDPDEGRYAEVAREMLSSGDWVTPRLNDFKFFDKPPLHYWGSAISMSILGTTNVAARLWSAGLGFLGALWMLFLGNRLYGGLTGRYTFLILLSSVLYVIIGHANVLDMGVSVFLAISLGAFAIAQTERDTETRGQGWMLLSWAGLAGALLSKGLIGIVFPGAAITLYSLWQKDWVLWRHLFFVKGLFIFFCLVLPWFVLVSQENEQFLHFFFIHEHFERFTSNVHGRSKPWWYFIVALIIGFVPWVINIIYALVKPDFSWKPTNAGAFEPSRLFWVYAVFILLFFSISNSKLVPYILPVFPFLALLAGVKLAKNSHFTSSIFFTGILAITVAIVAWKIIDFAKPDTPISIFIEYRPWLIAASISLAGACIFSFLYRQKHYIAIPVIALFSMLSFQLGSWGYQSHSSLRSTKAMADVIRSIPGQKNVNIFAINLFDYSLPYYLKRNITVVGFKGNMEFGIGREPDKWVSGELEFLPLWLEAKQALAILSLHTYQAWQKHKMPMKVIYQSPRRIVVSKN